MPTTGLRFSPTYDPQTPIGAALQNIGNALFGGPTAFQREATLAQAERARVAAEIEQRKLTGMDKLAGLVDTATSFSKYAPGRPRDPKDPYWETNAASAKNFYDTEGGQLAAEALRNGIPLAEASSARVLARSTPMYNDSMRSDAYVGTGKALQPYGAFSEKGQLAAEGRETTSKSTVAAAGAAAAHPIEYAKLAEIKGILKDQPANSPDRRNFALGERPTTEMQNKRDRAVNLGLDPTEMETYDTLKGQLDMYVRQSPVPEMGVKAFEQANPQGAARLRQIQQKSMDFQNSPRIVGQQRSVAPSGQMEWTVPSDVRRGAQVPAWRGEDGQWYKQEADGKTYRLTSRNY